jgi:hypothetical protein
MKKIIELFNFLTIGAFLSTIILFIGDLFGFSLSLNFQLLWRVLAGFLALTVLLNTGNIKRLLKISTTSKKFLLLSGLNLFLFALFLLFYPIFRFGSPFVWEDRIANFKAAKRIEITLNEPLKQSFQAKSNNLGTIGLKIIIQEIIEEEPEEATTSAELRENEETGAVQGVNIEEGELDEELNGELFFGEPERIVFRIKKEEKKDYFYENTYELNQYWETNYFLFGFPIQKDSEDKNYVFEIEKNKEGETNKVFLIERDLQGRFNFYPRYVYNLASLKTDWDPILLNISHKTSQFLEEKTTQFNLIFVFILIEFLILVFLKKEQERFKEKLNFYLKYGFLAGLLLITISSLKFEFIKNINYLQIVIDNLSKHNFLLIFLAITLGFLLFYFNHGIIEEEIEREEEQKELLEEKRLQEFPKKFSKILKIPVLRNVVRWIYKEGWGFSISLFLIALIFIIIKAGMPLIFTGSYIDEYFHISSGIEIFKSGSFPEIYPGSYYSRGALVSFFVGFFIFLFGKNIFVAKMVPASIGIINFFLLYLISRKFFIKKHYVLLLMLIYTFSYPVILNHFYIRFYVFYELFFLLNIFFIINFVNSLKNENNYKLLVNIIFILTVNIFGYFLIKDIGYWIILVFILTAFACIYLFNTIKNSNKFKFFGRLLNIKKKYKIIALIVLGTISGIFLNIKTKIIFLISSPDGNPLFSQNSFSYNDFFFKTNLILTMLFLLGLLEAIFYLIINKKQKIKLYPCISLGALILFILHFFSSNSLQTLRNIVYFLPLIYLISINYLSKIKLNNLLKIIIVALLFISLYCSYSNDFFDNPSFPRGAAYFGGEIYEDVNSICRDKLIITSHFPHVLNFYGITPDYGLQNIGYENERNIVFDKNFSGYHYVYPKNIEVITSLEQLKEIFNSHSRICYIERSLVNNARVDREIQDFIKNNFQLYERDYFRQKLFIKD